MPFYALLKPSHILSIPAESRVVTKSLGLADAATTTIFGMRILVTIHVLPLFAPHGSSCWDSSGMFGVKIFEVRNYLSCS